ncbi:MAG TPA: universal stress protein [Acidimicrobiales bacterium]|nr:universal stress protein [Acidimicrobiales bacterium]
MVEVEAEPREDISDAVKATGKFRIYLGAAAGVGKTIAMLSEGRRRRERGRDVVVGFVETHGRPHTAEEIGPLEVVPRRKVDYRGAVFEEMDLDAVLARRPEVALVDELAHTNVPGSGRNEKRWQDVLELLDAGIAVVSTVNIQHLESIADAVESITETRVRERVPDWVVRKADQLELVDSSPEQLRRRMLHGNIYPPDKVPRALSSFFKTENLVALRELALRFVADETEEDLLSYLSTRGPGATWDTNERIMVAVTNAPGTSAVVRRAARIAKRMKSDLAVVSVKTDSAQSQTAQAELESVRKCAENVGGIWYEVPGDDAAHALVDFARAHNITQIVLGSSRRSRLEEIARGSIVSKVLRYAAEHEIDVHVIARRDEREHELAQAVEE